MSDSGEPSRDGAGTGTAVKRPPIPEAMRTAGAVRRRGDRYTYTRVLPVDVEIMRFLLRFKYGRTVQVAGWVGASGSYAYERLRMLDSFGFVERDKYAVGLREWPDQHSAVKGRAITVWRVTQKGRDRLDPWPVAGEPETLPVLLKASQFSKTMGDHSLGVADLGVMFRRWGFEVATEREYVSLEMPQRVAPAVSDPVWCPHVAGKGHAPDLGVIHPSDGTMWGIELERAVKREHEYRDVISAYQRHGLGQIWYAASGATAANLRNAAASVGYDIQAVTVQGRTLLVSADGRFRLIGWLPSFNDPKRMSEWSDVWTALDGGVPPAGLEGVGAVRDLAASWRM